MPDDLAKEYAYRLGEVAMAAYLYLLLDSPEQREKLETLLRRELPYMYERKSA